MRSTDEMMDTVAKNIMNYTQQHYESRAKL